MTVTKQQVIAAFAELRVNRPRHLADRHIRNLLRTYSTGANNIGELSPDFYFHVFVAAGRLGSVCAPVTGGPSELPPGDWEAVERRKGPARTRSFTPLVKNLTEKPATARAKTRRSAPSGRVNLGNASRPEDQADDVARDFPAGEKLQ